MKYPTYEIALSPARLNKYLIACNNNKAKALSVYRHNVKLCQKFYGILNIFEVVLRNAINRHYKAHFNDENWIINQTMEGGMLEHCPQKIEIQRTANLLSRQNRYTNDRIVSSVSFGFWTYLFNRIPFRLGGMNLLQVFPKRAPGLAQRPIYNELQQIKAFRNRIAHHEAICFDSNGQINLGYANENLSLIKKYVSFLGYEPQDLYWGFGIRPYSLLEHMSEI